jgi:hypothetical protein
VRTTLIAAALVASLLGSGMAAAQTGSPSSPTAGPFTISAEALLWWLKDSPAPTPLVSDGPIDRPGTRIFLGGEDLDANPLPGFRVGAGYALSDRWGVEGSFFYLPTRTTTRSVSSSGRPGSVDLKIPFFDPISLSEDDSLLSSSAVNADQDPYAGFATERLRTSFLGAELNGTMRLVGTSQWRVDALGGLRYLRLRETYTFDTSSPFIPPGPSDVWLTKDEFDATNHFFGPQVGVRARADWGPLFLNAVVKVGFGAVRQHVDVSGSLITNDFNNFGPPQTFAGGYFAQPTNIGHHSRTVFGVVPEAALTAGWRLTRSVSLTAGYTFLYVNNVARPGNQIDRTINPTGIAAITGEPPAPFSGPARPAFKFNGSDFWAHGLNIGLAFNF